MLGLQWDHSTHSRAQEVAVMMQQVAMLYLEPHLVDTTVHRSEQGLIYPDLSLVTHVGEDHYLLPSRNILFPSYLQLYLLFSSKTIIGNWYGTE